MSQITYNNYFAFLTQHLFPNMSCSEALKEYSLKFTENLLNLHFLIVNKVISNNTVAKNMYTYI